MKAIAVYQALKQTEKIFNHTERPDLVYSQLTTFDLLLKQIKKDGIGIIVSSLNITTSTKKLFSEKDIQVINHLDLSSLKENKEAKILIVLIKPGASVKISDLEFIAKQAGDQLKWITIVDSVFTQQLFKWELKLKYN